MICARKNCCPSLLGFRPILKWLDSGLAVCLCKPSFAEWYRVCEEDEQGRCGE